MSATAKKIFFKLGQISQCWPLKLIVLLYPLMHYNMFLPHWDEVPVSIFKLLEELNALKRDNSVRIEKISKILTGNHFLMSGTFL